MKAMAGIFICLILTITYHVTPAPAGGNSEVFDITAMEPSPIEGQVLGKVIDQGWDTRCIPVQFRMNDTLDPIPNPLGEDFLTLAKATRAVEKSFDAWNSIPTSFIDMRVTGTTSNQGLVGLDMINEVTFRPENLEEDPFLLGITSTFVSINDEFMPAGTDIDGDGDSDVSGDITTCQDADGDGDIEFPEGSYKAGTVFDTNVSFNTGDSTGSRFTVNPADADTNPDSVDLIAVATHEFGHAHGLEHTIINQVNPTRGDGTQATMFPFLETQDPVNELSQRTLETDDVAYSSFFYPEGSAAGGPAALQEGDVAFNEAFGLIRGRLFHGELNQPVAGGSIFAVNVDTGEIAASAISGTTQLSFDPETGGEFLIDDPSIAILDGRYVLPVPPGTYKIGVEPIDGFPVLADSDFNFTTFIASIFPGLLDFDEESFDGKESDLEVSPASAAEITVEAGQRVRGIRIITNRTININNFGDIDSIGFTDALPGTYYAVRIPAEQVAGVNPGEDILVQAATFFTVASDPSVVPVFAEALLTTGVLNADGTVSIDLSNPLERVTGFIAQDFDFSPFYFGNPRGLGRTVREGIEDGTIGNLFLVLRIPTDTPFPFPGAGGLPHLIGLDGFDEGNFEDNDDTPPLGLSFVSEDNGVTFIPVSEFSPGSDFDFMFGLILSEAPPHSSPLPFPLPFSDHLSRDIR